MSWLMEQFSLLRAFLRGRFRRTMGMCALGMLLSALLGFGIGLLSPERASQVLSQFMAQVQESGVVSEEGQLSVFALLMNNWRAMLLSAAYGFIPFLYLPILSLMANGALLGLLAALFQAEGTSLLVLGAGILPHGIFELPALILSIACGVTLCSHLCAAVTGRPDQPPFLAVLEDLLRVLVLVVAPLTVAAAFVECYITPVLMNLVM